MKVIFLKSVARQGNAGEIKEVSDGYAQNFLLPRKLAEQATAVRVAHLQKVAEHRAAEDEKRRAEQEALVKKLDGHRFEATVSANKKGGLYEKITTAEKLSALVPELPAEIIHLTEPITATGEHTVAVTSGEAKGEVTIALN